MMNSQIPHSGDRHLVTFGKGVVLFWIVTCLGPPQLSAIQNKPTPAKEAPVRAESELTPEKSAPITPEIPAVAPQNARVRELQEERLKVCQELVKIIDVQIQNGLIDMGAAWRARENLLDAQLDLCETKADRIRVHQELVQVLESWHKAAKTMFENAVANRTEELGVRSNLLKAKIALEKEKLLPN